MSKKTIAFILLGIAAVGVIVYLLMNKSGTMSSTVAGTGSGSGNSQFDKDDNDAYNKMKALIPGGPPNWVSELVLQRYDSNPGMAGAYRSKAITFHNVVSEVAPNDSGTFPATSWSGGKKLLWSDQATMTPMWNLRAALLNKYQQL